MQQTDHFGAQVAHLSDCVTARNPLEVFVKKRLADIILLLAIEATARTGQPQANHMPPRSRHPSADLDRLSALKTHPSVACDAISDVAREERAGEAIGRALQEQCDHVLTRSASTCRAIRPGGLSTNEMTVSPIIRASLVPP